MRPRLVVITVALATTVALAVPVPVGADFPECADLARRLPFETTAHSMGMVWADEGPSPRVMQPWTTSAGVAGEFQPAEPPRTLDPPWVHVHLMCHDNIAEAWPQWSPEVADADFTEEDAYRMEWRERELATRIGDEAVAGVTTYTFGDTPVETTWTVGWRRGDFTIVMDGVDDDWDYETVVGLAVAVDWMLAEALAEPAAA